MKVIVTRPAGQAGELARALEALGVDGVITNDPRLFAPRSAGADLAGAQG